MKSKGEKIVGAIFDRLTSEEVRDFAAAFAKIAAAAYGVRIPGELLETRAAPSGIIAPGVAVAVYHFPDGSRAPKDIDRSKAGAVFVRWVESFEEFNEGPGNYTMGLVQLPGGWLETVAPELLRVAETGGAPGTAPDESKELAELVKGRLAVVESNHAAEKLGGNPVKLEYWKGAAAELHALRHMLAAKRGAE